MAEGVDNDMSEQQREQASVPHGQEAVRSPQVQFAIPPTNLQTGLAPQPTVSLNSAAPHPGHKKKSSFQITSVTETKVRNRGDSNGYDGELDLNESDIIEEEVEVELEPFSEPGTANGNGGSRFKVVKIQRDKSYVRGRWNCHDFPDVESMQSSSTNVSAPSSTNISAQPSKDNVEKTDSHSNTRNSTTSNSIGNHIASDTDTQLSENQTHGSSSVKSTATQANEHNSISGEVNISLKKKDSETKLGIVGELAKQSDSSVIRLASGLENFDGTSLEGAQSIATAGPGHVEAEMPIVNKIATAMEQITQIKSDLLSVVNKEVQTLKETISKLTEENQELKLENEKLRTLMESKNST